MRVFSGTLLLVACCSFFLANIVTASSQDGTISGTVVDAETGEPLTGATVRIRDTDRGRATDGEGEFVFANVAPGTYRVVAAFLGYASEDQAVQVSEDADVTIRFTLSASSLELPDVVVTGTGRERGLGDVYRPTSVLVGDELQRNLGSSVPETLSRVPGFSASYNGPAATRPTIRGLGGDRVLMLEDGQRTGDLYSTASDHAVAIDPVAAERMEVLRGPAGLLYGSNALGGVVNVIRNEVPRRLPDTVGGTFTTQLESVNMGGTGGVLVAAPMGPVALRAEVSGRLAGDTRTPLGNLPSTDMETYNASFGASLIQDWGAVGGAYRYFNTDYGVPGEFEGEVIRGAHAGGVYIRAERHVARFRATYEEGSGLAEDIELDVNYTRYLHREIEQQVDEGDDVVGARFDQISGEANLTARHDHELDEVQVEGAFGFSTIGRDLLARGFRPGTRSAREWSVAAFAYEELGWGPFRLQAGLRYDYSGIEPYDTSPINVEGRSKEVSSRSFGDVTGSVSTLYTLADAWTLGASLSRSFRNPSIEELYSDGPHLADFSFDIGSPNLDSEIGHGLDIFVRTAQSRFNLELTGYLNHISNYIYYRPTGEVALVPIAREVPIFEAAGDDARFVGLEGAVKWEPISNWLLDANASYTHAERLNQADPLPFIPPLNGHVEVRYQGDTYFASVEVDAAAAQNRVPQMPTDPSDEATTINPQTPTNEYALLNLGSGARFSLDHTLHIISLRIDNVFDTVWRDHLSRIKEVAPQPGRNLRLTYRIRF